TAAAITATATGFIAWFTLILKRATDKLWDAGERQIRLTERALTSTERAFIYVDTIEAHVINQYLRVMPKWGNSGTTATKRMVNYINWKIFGSDGPASDFDYPDFGPNGET